jgi:hypothetical protein
MAKQDEKKGSGNDGSWFLEAVGALPSAPTPSETVAALELDNTVTDISPVKATSEPEPEVAYEQAIASFDGGTGTSTLAFKRPTEIIDDIEETTPVPPTNESNAQASSQLSHVLRTRRSFRWPVVLFGILVIAVAAVAAFWLPAYFRQEAVATKQAYADASLALRTELPLGQTALDTVTDLSSTPEELSASIPAISQLDSVAHDLAVEAAEPLPRQIPVFPVRQIDDLDPLQDTAQINAAQGSDIARRLGYTYVYRTTIPQLLTTGDLPTTADVQTINELSVLLASSLVDDSNAISDLPTTEATSDVNDAAHAAVERFALWQDEYLTALAENDEDGAARLVLELDGITINLDSMLAEALGVARIDIDQQIIELAADLEKYLEELTR